MVWSYINATVRRIDSLDVKEISKGRGRPKKAWIETVVIDLNTFNLTGKIALDWTARKCKIRIADLS